MWLLRSFPHWVHELNGKTSHVDPWFTNELFQHNRNSWKLYQTLLFKGGQKLKKHDKIRVITVSISCAVYYKRMVAEQQNSVAQIGFRVLSPWLRCRLASWPGWFSNRDPGALGEESTLLGGWAPSGLKLLRFTPLYKPWSSAIWKGSHNPGGLTITMVINH